MSNEELELQKKQLFAQRATAVASAVSAAAAVKTAGELERMRLDAREAAEATERHEQATERLQREMAARQNQMAEEQRLTNFRQTILATLPLLKEEEKAQYVIEQLSPAIEKKYEKVISEFVFGVFLMHFKFLDFSKLYFESQPDAKEFMVEGKNSKLKLNKATNQYQNVQKKLEDVKSNSGFGCAVVSAMALAILAFLVCAPIVAYFTPGNPIGMLGMLLILFVSGLAFLATLIGADKEQSKKVSQLSSKVSILKAEMDRETEAFESWAKKQPESWRKIKTDLVDSYLASEDGKKFIQYNIFDAFMRSCMCEVADEQSFLPPSARPSDEQWQSAFAPKVEPQAELATQRQLKIRDILLSRLVPDYETQKRKIVDFNEKFVELDLDRVEAKSIEWSSSERK